MLFCRAVYSVLSKVVASEEEAVIHLTRIKCLPVILYGVDAISLGFSIRKFIAKTFIYTNNNVLDVKSLSREDELNFWLNLA
jgi:hypothetical protein